MTETKLRLPGEDDTGAAILPEVTTGPPRLDSRHLLGGGREVVIAHDGADYRLRLTASGKLILTK